MVDDIATPVVKDHRAAVQRHPHLDQVGVAHHIALHVGKIDGTDVAAYFVIGGAQRADAQLGQIIQSDFDGVVRGEFALAHCSAVYEIRQKPAVFGHRDAGGAALKAEAGHGGFLNASQSQLSGLKPGGLRGLLARLLFGDFGGAFGQSGFDLQDVVGKRPVVDQLAVIVDLTGFLQQGAAGGALLISHGQGGRDLGGHQTQLALLHRILRVGKHGVELIGILQQAVQMSVIFFAEIVAGGDLLGQRHGVVTHLGQKTVGVVQVDFGGGQ
jgi:hypothetical protein